MAQKVYLKPPLLDHLLIVDGFSRSGKVLLSKLISHLSNVEFFQFCVPLDHVPILWKFGQMDTNTARSFLRISIDTMNYDRFAGRYLNTRFSDGSAVQHAADYPEIIKRIHDIDINANLAKAKEDGRWPLFMTHELMPHAKLVLSIMPETKMIEAVRHPIDLSHSWLQRGWGGRWGVDPTAFIPVADHNGSAVPWFAMDRTNDYIVSNAADRVIHSIEALTQLAAEAYDALSDADRAKIHFVPYEQLMTDPLAAMKDILPFINTEIPSHFKVVLARENLPNSAPIEARDKKREDLHQVASPAMFDRLMMLVQNYEKKWGICSA